MRTCLLTFLFLLGVAGLVLLVYPYASAPCDKSPVGEHPFRHKPGVRPVSLSTRHGAASSRTMHASEVAMLDRVNETSIPADSVCSPPKRLRLVVGVISAPNNFDRRMWMRQKMRVSEVHASASDLLLCCALTMSAHIVGIRGTEHTG